RSRDRHRELATALQHCPAACFDRLPRTRPGGVRPRARRMAGCAIPTRCAGHAPAGATADAKLTFKPDHQAGAGHSEASSASPEVNVLQNDVRVFVGHSNAVDVPLRKLTTASGVAAIQSRLWELPLMPPNGPSQYHPKLPSRAGKPTLTGLVQFDRVKSKAAIPLSSGGLSRCC